MTDYIGISPDMLQACVRVHFVPSRIRQPLSVKNTLCSVRESLVSASNVLIPRPFQKWLLLSSAMQAMRPRIYSQQTTQTLVIAWLGQGGARCVWFLCVQSSLFDVETSAGLGLTVVKRPVNPCFTDVLIGRLPRESMVGRSSGMSPDRPVTQAEECNTLLHPAQLQ